MGFIGGIISSVCSAIGSACNAIGGALFGGAGGIGTLAVALFPPLAPTISEILIAIGAISTIVSAIVEALGLKNKEETPEELGMKAEISDKKPEDFDTIEEYINYLRKEVTIDEQRVENLSPEEKAKYMSIGTALYIKEIEEKYGIEAPGEFWRTAEDRELNGEEVHECIKNFKEHGITDMKDMSDYLNGKDPESGTEKYTVYSAIIETMKELEPGISDEELAEKFSSMINIEE